MQYRIDISPGRQGYARVDFAGRALAIEVGSHVGPVWLVGVSDLTKPGEGSVTVRAPSANDAVWKVAQAAVRAVAELTGSRLDGDITPSHDDPPTNQP